MRLETNPDLRRMMGKAAQTRIVTAFSLGHWLDQTLTAYRELLL